MKNVNLWVVLFGAIFSSHLSAYEISAVLALDAEHSDNMSQLPDTLATSDTLLAPSIKISATADYSSVSATADYSARYHNYKNSTFPDRTDLIGQSSARVTLLSNRLFWNFYQNSSRLSVDQLTVDTPTNQTNRDMWQTGPELRVTLGARTSLTLSGEYAQSILEGPFPDTTQTAYRFELNHSTTAKSQWGIFARSADTFYKIDTSDYSTDRYGINVNYAGNAFALRVNLGVNAVDRDSGSSFSGLFISADISRQQRENNFSLAVVSELTDASTGLSQNSQLPDRLDVGDGNLNNSDIIERKRIDFRFSRSPQTSRISINAGAYFDTQDFQTDDNDQKTLGATMTVAYRMTRTARVSYALGWSRTDLETIATPPDSHREDNHRLTISFGDASSLTAELWVGKRRRTYDSGTRDFDELGSGISLRLAL